MPQNCTILSPTDEPQQIITLIRGLVSGKDRLTVDGKERNWSSLTINSVGASLVLNRSVFRRNGDAFAKLRYGLWMYFDRIETKFTAVKLDVLQRIEECTLAIGVVAEPEFVEAAGHFKYVSGVARAMRAIIWNGSGVTNSEGRLMFDGDGNSETDK